MKIKALVLLILGLLVSIHVFAQSVANVNPLSGVANVSIPIYNMSSGQVSIPISLSYNSGVKPLDIEGTAGIGWQINIGGQINRQVRGLPDDATKDGLGNTLVGWMSSINTAANAINGFTIQNDGGLTCTKETNDINYINANFPFNYDTEPDIFYVGAPGLSCQLIYNRTTGKFVPVNYEDMVITFTTDPTSGLLTSFTIINDKGIKYVFAAVQKVMQTTVGGTPTYFTTKFKQYQNRLTYNEAWHLSSITDNNGNGFILSYIDGDKRSSTDPLSLYLPGATTATLQYNVQRMVWKPVLASIKSNNINGNDQKLSFSWGINSISAISGMGRRFEFDYSSIKYPGSSYERLFLRKVFEWGCASPINYQFAYGGETLTQNGYTTILPDSASVKADY